MIEIERIQYNTLLYYKDYTEQIPTKPGNYYWVYFVDFDYESSFDDIYNTLKKFSSDDLNRPTIIKEEKFRVTIEELTFTSLTEEQCLFGLNIKEESILKDFLQASKKNVLEFKEFYKTLCFKRPFYIGKAGNLRERLQSHFSSKTGILHFIDEKSIHYKNIWIGYEIIDNTTNEKLLNIFEKISQKKLKPGLTKRYG